MTCTSSLWLHTRSVALRPAIMVVALALCVPALVLPGHEGSTSAVVAAPLHQAPPPDSTRTPPTPILLTDPVADPHQPEALYFAPTGHTLRGSFLQYWQEHGGLSQFGYPITEEFVEPNSPGMQPLTLTVQYFQRNRFEHHPENQPPSDVLLGTLGREFLPANAPSAKVTPLPAPVVYFPETGHNLSGEFKVYWETHGGLGVHGYPVTEPFMERSELDGKEYRVQYFERSRMELHPENAGTEYEVLLGQLGRQLAGAKGYFSGAYPRYGHAADFSWISGQIVLYRNPGFNGVYAGCFLLEYEQFGNMKVQLNGPGPSGKLLQLGTLVVFGRFAQRGESYVCLAEREVPGYIYDTVQANLVP